MWFPLDFPVPTEHFSQRVLTVQATGPKSSGAHVPLAWRTRDSKSKVSVPVSQGTSETTTYTKFLARNAGVALSPSSGLWMSALFNEEQALVRSVPDTGQWLVGGAHEQFRIREVQARAGFELTNNVQVGFGIRSQNLRSEILGTLNSSAGDLLVYSGSRLGVVAGMMIGSPALSLALNYQTPVTGKVQIQGESKVTSVSGYLGAALKFVANNETSLFAEYGLYNASKNELGTAVPLSTNNSRSVLPLGVSVDSKLIPTSVLGVGVTQQLSSSSLVSIDIVRGGAYESSDAALLVPDDLDSDSIQKTYLARLGLSLTKSEYETQLFFDYSQLSFSGAQNTPKRSRESTAWGFGLRAGVELGG